MPRTEPAPGRLSTRTVCLRRFVRSGEIIRATTSVLPPGAHGTSMRTDFSGHAEAAMLGAVMHPSERATTAKRRRVRFMRVLWLKAISKTAVVQPSSASRCDPQGERTKTAHAELWRGTQQYGSSLRLRQRLP